jgi:5'-3' exonuclease
MQKVDLTPQMDKNDITLVIDGRYLAYRTQYSRQGYLQFNNVKTGMFYGFLNTLQSVANKYLATNTVIAWDITPTEQGIRRGQFQGYKVRKIIKEMTPEEQKTKAEFENSYKQLMVDMQYLGFADYHLIGYEADDIIALFVKQFSNGQNIIVTKDEDMYQLINQNTWVYDPDKKIKKNIDWFRKTYGIEPLLWADYKAIAGCQSDTVPGIAGMGEKYTLQYLKGEANERIIEKVKDNIEQFNLCYELVKLPHPSLKNHKLPYKMTKLDEKRFFTFCQRYEFRSFLDKLHDFYIFMQ